MKAHPWILGISASHNNGAACLLKGNTVAVAIQEERLTRHKRHSISGSRPSLAVQYCLNHANIQVEDLDLVVLGCQTHHNSLENNICLNPQLKLADRKIPFLVVSHHLAHAISAYVMSGYNQAGILVVDGMGSPWEDLAPKEQTLGGPVRPNWWETVSLYAASQNSISPLFKDFVRDGAWLNVPEHGMPQFGSLGGMFSAAAHQIFGNIMEAGKVMGLAAYGTATIPVSEFYSIEPDCFTFTPSVCKRFQDDLRWPNHKTEYEDLAASVQHALEQALLYLQGRLSQLCSFDCLCLSGGVGLNSVSVDRLCRTGMHKDVYVFPAAEDSGIAIGAAYYGLWHLRGSYVLRRLKTDSFGHDYSRPEIADAISHTSGITIFSPGDQIDYAADALTEGKTVGWFRGGAELGPRALGQRSILFDPRRPEGKDYLNHSVKRRESFRPFAPACLAEQAPHWFDLGDGDGFVESPFMTRTVPVRPEVIRAIPGVVHIDGSARIQTVSQTDNPEFYALINRFYRRTGVPMLLNTSFNIAGQPLVETPADALWSMLALSLDVLVLGEWTIIKKPSINSLFDLCPVRLNRSMNVVFPAGVPRNGGSMTQLTYFSTPCETQWGSFERFFPFVVQDLLRNIDDNKSVREIFAALTASGHGLSELHMTHLIIELVHSKMIDLRESTRSN